MKKIKDKYLNTLKAKLILSISSIVLLSIFLIGIIFLTQYRRISLEQSEIELTKQATELGHIANSIYYPDPITQQRFIQTIRSMNDTSIWIIDLNGNIVIRSTDLIIDANTINKNKELIDKLDDKIIVDYNYIKSKTKILTVIAPTYEGSILTGAILLHKDVNTIYSSYTSLITLVIVSLFASLTLSIILAIFLSRYLTKPIEDITKVANEIKSNNYNIKTNIHTNDEIGILASTIDEMSTNIENNIKDIKELENRAKELVANVSHEFKTPLTLIRGYTLNLQDETIKPSKEVYEKIINNTKILEKLVNELLDLNAYESNKIILNKEDISLTDLLNYTINDMEYIAKYKNIDIKKTFTKDIIIEADYVKVRQLITIFLDNAIKYSPENSSIEVKLLNNEIIIKDNGIGMEKSELESLFERYYRVNNNELGYGLGMCIAKYIADLHNFKIDIKSKKNKGTTVSIMLK